MQNLSTAQRNWLMNGGLVTVTIPATLLDASVIQIDDIDILEDSVQIDRKSVSSNKLEIGSAETTELTFSLINDTGKFTGLKLEGAVLHPRFNINGEILQCGYFTIDEKPQSGTIMQVRALDRMAKFNKIYDSTLEYPATLQEILTDACTQCGVSLYNSTFPNYTFNITTPPDPDSTYHEIVSWVAQIAASNAFINVDGLLEFKWYSGSVETIPDTAIMECEFAENNVTITGVQYDDGDNTYLAGTETYTVDVTGNPFVMTDIATVLGLINALVNGFTYRPLKKLTCAVIMPHLWPMDMIDVIDDGITYHSIVTGNNISTASEITAAGEPEIIKGYAGAGLLTAHQKNIIKTLAKEIAGTKVTAMETELLALNEQITNALGFYTTVITNEDGSQTVYHHDHEILAESQYIDVKPSAGSFAWTTTGWNNGNPVWQYGVTQSGSLIMRIVSAIGINADWINAGTIAANRISIGSGSSFSTGYDPTTKETPAGAQAKADAAAAAAQSYVNSVASNLQNQIDGSITTWFYAYAPTTSNAPASGWTTTELKNQHLGDLFYDTVTGYCYRYLLSGSYSWVKITDTDITKALADAAAAQDTADNKRRVFVSQPVTPYEVGDLWSGGPSGELRKCKTERLSGSFNSADWEQATSYDKTSTVIENGLITTGTLQVEQGGTVAAGITGNSAGDDAVRFWAGSTFANRGSAPFKVTQSGATTYTATVNGKTVVVSIAPGIGIQISVDGTVVFGIDTSGKIFATSLTNALNSDYYMTYGFTGPFTYPGLLCVMPTYGAWLGICPSADGGIGIFDKNLNIRQNFMTNGSFSLYDSDGNVVCQSDVSSNFTQMHIPSSTNNAIGVDSTGAYKIIEGVKKYLYSVNQQTHRTDAKSDYIAGDLDTAAEIAAALNNTNAIMNSIIQRLENLQLFASS